MAFPQGIYFRATDDQVDPTNYDGEVGQTANYPRTSAQSNTVGWEVAPGGNTRDRGGAGAVELRGIVFAVNTNPVIDYRIDLPATGSYNIRLAMGDQGGAQSSRVRLLDTTTSLADVDAEVTSAHFYDATGVDRTSQSDWTTNNAALASQSFATTIFRVRVGASTHSVNSANSVIAAVYIESAGGGASAGGPLSFGGALIHGSLVRGGRLAA